jgi:hypothetical protein
MMEENFGIPQISKFITNLALFDGKPELIEKYATKVKAGKLDNLSGTDLKNYNSKMARIIKF